MRHLDSGVRGDEAPVVFALGTEHLLFLTEATEGFRVLMRNSYTTLEHGAIQNDVMSTLRDGESEKDDRERNEQSHGSKLTLT